MSQRRSSGPHHGDRAGGRPGRGERGGGCQRGHEQCRRAHQVAHTRGGCGHRAGAARWPGAVRARRPLAHHPAHLVAGAEGEVREQQPRHPGEQRGIGRLGDAVAHQRAPHGGPARPSRHPAPRCPADGDELQGHQPEQHDERRKGQEPASDLPPAGGAGSGQKRRRRETHVGYVCTSPPRVETRRCDDLLSTPTQCGCDTRQNVRIDPGIVDVDRYHRLPCPAAVSFSPSGS